MRYQFGTSREINLKIQSGTSSGHGGRRSLPFVFTEHGVAMLSSVMHTPIAIKVSIQIMSAFVEMRKIITYHSGLLQRMEGIERKQIESEQKFEKVFKALESNLIPSQGVFFDGQVFDAYELASRIIRSASKSIVLIDSYIDDTVLTHLSKKKQDVRVVLLTNHLAKQLSLDVQKANDQYGSFQLRLFSKSHDRFLIVDGKDVYHLGASLKDLGKKWFAFSKLDIETVKHLLDIISDLI